LYYRDAQVAILVYDITNRQSFEVMKSWVDELKQVGPEKVLYAIVGNKVDMLEDEVVSYEEAKIYAKSLGAMFTLTSAK
jgi:GTPase SAR1 family protein